GETVIKLGTEHLGYIIPCVDNFQIFVIHAKWVVVSREYDSCQKSCQNSRENYEPSEGVIIEEMGVIM
ncbi:6080_t:CDS:2, partial [Funneliformis caledonium]